MNSNLFTPEEIIQIHKLAKEIREDVGERYGIEILEGDLPDPTTTTETEYNRLCANVALKRKLGELAAEEGLEGNLEWDDLFEMLRRRSQRIKTEKKQKQWQKALPREVVSFSAAPSLVIILNTMAEQTGKSRSALVREIVEAYFTLPYSLSEKA